MTQTEAKTYSAIMSYNVRQDCFQASAKYVVQLTIHMLKRKIHRLRCAGRLEHANTGRPREWKLTAASTVQSQWRVSVHVSITVSGTGSLNSERCKEGVEWDWFLSVWMLRLRTFSTPSIPSTNIRVDVYRTAEGQPQLSERRDA